jgi:hypothetical protein
MPTTPMTAVDLLAPTRAAKSDAYTRFFKGFSDKSQPNTAIDFKQQICAVGTPLRLLRAVRSSCVPIFAFANPNLCRTPGRIRART